MSSTLNATIEHVNRTTSRATVRRHAVLVDRGQAKGGLDLGPAGGEYLLVALAGCFASHLLAAVAARDLSISEIKVTASGCLDSTPERFTSFTMDVTAECSDVAAAHKMIIIAARSCQVVNTLRHAAPVAISYKGSSVELGS